MAQAHLRPIERRILELDAAGIDHAEIARRFRRSPAHVARIIAWTQLPQREARSAMSGELRPIERRILKLRASGMNHEEIGERFRRGSAHIRRVEGLAHYKKALRLLAAEA